MKVKQLVLALIASVFLGLLFDMSLARVGADVFILAFSGMIIKHISDYLNNRALMISFGRSLEATDENKESRKIAFIFYIIVYLLCVAMLIIPVS
ncbi:hypothetical protein [Agarivorans aestuarii]|uniref:hypothetical protein n=1 Tax=Agarivorans aestuarii TaxID=1563703 RepID=UPI001C81B557|nr:hypothetical protein [Agarivorans aestuarii]